MLTPLQRGLLVIIFGLVAVLMIIWQSLCGIRLEKRAYTYLFLMSIMFPLIDLGIERGGFRLSIFNVATTAYLLFNWKMTRERHCILCRRMSQRTKNAGMNTGKISRMPEKGLESRG